MKIICEETGKQAVAIGTGKTLSSGRRLAFALGVYAAIASFAGHAAVQIDSKPLTVTNAVPGNVVLVPSFEWPTAITHANYPGKTTTYASTVDYAGYFNPKLCYEYVYAASERERYFRPVANASSNRTCTGTNWSGNFMNWAAAQAVDTFRMALTGGYRVKDVVGDTWLEKGVSDRYSSSFNPNRSTTSVAGNMPGDFSQVAVRIGGLGNQMWFRSGNSISSSNAFLIVGDGLQSAADTTAVPYNPSVHSLPNSTTSCPSTHPNWVESAGRCRKGSSGSDYADPITYGNNAVYAVSVRVQVCDAAGVDRRTFCRMYAANNWKPEGLIQQNSRRLRYSAFGYQVSDKNNDGAVLKARQKFVGPRISGEKLYPDLAADTRLPMDNPEWDAATGIIYDNPDSVDAAATNALIGSANGCIRPDGSKGGCNIPYSGVINYINRFGQVPINFNIPLKGGSGSPHSGSGAADNVADLYYAALRYIRGEGPELTGDYANTLKDTGYANGAANTDAVKSTNRYSRSGGMPSITKWYGPTSGDTTKWTAAAGASETSRVSDYDPMLYRCQSTVLLGIGDTSSNESRDSGNGLTGGNSAIYSLMRGDDGVASNGNRNSLAAMAMWAHLKDLRTDIPNVTLADGVRKRGQSISTYWVDVVEKGEYRKNTENQYYLATKYGGYRIPDEHYDAQGNAAAPANSTWWANNRSSWTSKSSNITSSSSDGNFIQPNNLYFANGGDAMIEGLTQAFSNILDDISGSGGSFASNTTRLETGAFTFQAKYSSNGWGGELVASAVNTSTGALTRVWDAKDWLLGHQVTSNADSFRKRKIYYGTGVANPLDGSRMALAFTQNAANPTIAAGLETLFASHSSISSLSSDGEKLDRIRYVLGERSKERQFGGQLRNRRGMLGDIVNSQPVFMGRPNSNLYPGNTSYAGFVASMASRQPVLFVGANDGFLHAIDAGNGATAGQELFAFMPREAVEVLAKQNESAGQFPYWHPEYEHRYSVDGDMTVADVYDGSKWMTLLVGVMGRGGRTIYAMDVTDPGSPKLLWEKNRSDIPDMGNVLGKPIVARISSNEWRIFFGNGPNSNSGQSRLLGLSISNGSVLTNILAGDGGAASDNGLGPINVWDDNRDGIFDTVYAGDMHGKMYRFRLADDSVSVLYDASYRGGKKRPITAAPLVARNPYSPPDVWVYFGTGRYLSLTDTTAAENAHVQAWYGMMDKGTQQTAANLQKIGILHEDSKGRVIEAKSGLGGKEGWYMELKLDSGTARGERMVVSPFFQGLTLIGTTRFPDSSDVCSPSGFGYTMAIDPFTGGRLSSVFFDADNNGTVGNPGDYNNNIPYSGLLYNSGPNNPIFIGDLMYTSMDDGSARTVLTRSTIGTVKRVSWREVLSAN